MCAADLVLHLLSKSWQELSMECKGLGLSPAGRKQELGTRIASRAVMTIGLERLSFSKWVVTVGLADGCSTLVGICCLTSRLDLAALLNWSFQCLHDLNVHFQWMVDS